MRHSILLCCLALLLPSFSSAVKLAAPPADAPVPARVAVLADRDGDGLGDSLQQQLATAAPDARFDVVLTFLQPAQAAAARQTLGNFVPRHEFRLIPGFAGRLSAAQIRGLLHAPGLLRIEEDATVRTQLNAARADFGIEAARGLAEGGLIGRNVGICTVDTGVDPQHEQLDNGKVAAFIDYIAGRSVAYDDNGHGTHVAAIAAGDGSGGSAAAAFRGVASGAALYAAKVLDAQGSGAESDVVAGIQWCAAQAGVHVISMSLAALPPADGKDAMSQAVDAAVAAGKVLVVAAGNDGDEPGTVGSPGAAVGAITVGACAEWSASPAAVNHSDGVYLTAFSSRGPITVNASTSYIKPDICGPGHSIAAAAAGSVADYVAYSGTSMATPFVAGAVALALEANPALKGNPAQVRSLLEGSAQDRGASGKDNEWGAGLLDGYAFVARAQNAAASVRTAMPTAVHLDASVGNNQVWSHSFSLAESDLGQPLAATVTIVGQPLCTQYLFGFCFAYQWDPDLDARLLAPDGTQLSFSGCMGAGTDCAAPRAPLVALGRQETLHAMPTVAGTYRIEVWGDQDPNGVNKGKGGSFALDLSRGPLAATVASPDFSLSTTPASRSVVSGGSTSYTTTVTATGGFGSSVDLGVSGLPAGASGSFSPDPLSGGSGSSTLSVSTSSATSAGSYPLLISGVGGGLSRSSAATLLVTAPSADFALAVSPSSRTVKRGSRTSYTVTVSALNGFNGAVTLGVSNLPSGVTFGFSPNPVAGAGSSTLTVKTAKTTSAGSYQLQVTGSSGSLSHSQSVGLVVR
ncbi:S8 family serine peptidase [Vogesella sp. LYT5W]|uniref:S8 family serine peptidase n=1 Tax=Vogesella margarita TaxID=2984199 RepID=A0ABT5IMP1_9NEIS|nr:S8 family serine peptidase [Vogesella margarita]MDC7713787.1 S8 family serine peptidase [Vogesella margarita]